MKNFINRPRYMFMSLVIIGACMVIAIQSYYEHKLAILEKDISDLEEKTITYRDAIKQTKSEENERNQGIATYKEWEEAEQLADHFVEKSDGKFKEEWALFMINEAKKENVDPSIVYELLAVETGERFDPTLQGPDTVYGRAYGLAQFMKNTAPWIADMAGLEYEDELLFNPYYSIQLSITYLNFLHERYDGDWDQALTAYNRGIYGLEEYIEENGHAQSGYAKKIQNNAKENELIAFNE
ncbi:lytic transglycosylase domain-containing protein [Bacillus solimangrovi]|uniref:Transglycosylase SLT domain-containing protein n=1 Tax=Bacillus solimangrovi TaxID=1305675 RepID=A0A1E5LI27_9BACI|nr:transglycosylase SLT domain-containing protein [Bacillus solimangrovi]OEH93725.1 hypothetical protein BFG57_11855 [Bacillus solimangrovi]